MESTYDFLSLVLDTVPDQIVVINEVGDIKFVNKGWTGFAENNGCLIDSDWSGANYIQECNKAAELGDKFAKQVLKGIRRVLEKKVDSFYFEYPCHSPDENRWFMMRVVPFYFANQNYLVISHQNITERRLIEEKVSNLARLDGLTQMPNRRTLNEFLHDEWRRCSRLKRPICLAIIDLDHFKLLNDTYGHQTGDDSLIEVGKVIGTFVNRPSDFCARYGGEEFAFVFGSTALEDAKVLLIDLLQKISDLNIPNAQSPTHQSLTASIGLAEVVPSAKKKENDLINRADEMLYKAKANGRNRLES